jgi:hypothetical protein
VPAWAALLVRAAAMREARLVASPTAAATNESGCRSCTSCRDCLNQACIRRRLCALTEAARIAAPPGCAVLRYGVCIEPPP